MSRVFLVGSHWIRQNQEKRVQRKTITKVTIMPIVKNDDWCDCIIDDSISYIITQAASLFPSSETCTYSVKTT